MDRPVELVPLICIKCSTPVPAGSDEVAWVCTQCGQGLVLDEAQGLLPLEVQYSDRIAPNAVGKPFWVAEGKVTLERETYSGNKSREAQAFWSYPHRFCVPAFTCSLETLLSLGTNLLQNPPDLRPGPAARFEPVTLYPEDVQAAAEFIVTAVEAGRKDKLKEIRFNLDLSPPCLWVLP